MQVAMIGLGMVAETHLAALRDADSVTLAGILGRDPSRTQAFAAHAADVLCHPVELFSDAESIASSADIDFVILATPPDARMTLVEALVAARKPILMEKPIERDLTAAKRIVDLCEAADVPLGVVFQHRARAASIVLKRTLSEGSLGDIATVELKVPWWRAQSYYDTPGRGSYARDGGGVMITQAIHTLDLALWLLGPMAEVQAMMCRTPLHDLEAEDWAGAVFRMESGAVGTMTATTAAFPGGAESITLQGTKAAAHLASGTLTVTPLEGPAKTYGAQAATGGGADPMGFTHAWHQAIIEDFARSLATGKEPLASGRSALQVHAVIDAMTRASMSGKRESVAVP
jgi:predicted dehydrogenase